MTGTEHPRSIRSFVTRGGRITAAQQRALTALWPKYGVAFGMQVLDVRALFGRDAPRTIEIGFGNGDNLLALAAAHPARDFLGVEVHRPGVGRLLLGLEERRLANVRVICHDAVEVFERQIAPQSVHEILILFPDPWPKKRHHKRRLIQRPFAELAVSRLTHGGVLRLATDWQPYALEMLATLMATPGLENLAPKALSCRGRRNARPRASSGAASASGMRSGTWRSGEPETVARLQLTPNAWRSPSSTNCTASAPRITPSSRAATLAPVTPITRISGSASSISASAMASTSAAAASSAPKSTAWPARCRGPNHSRMVASARDLR